MRGHQRLRDPKSIKRVREMGRSFAHPLFVMRLNQTPDQSLRAAVVAGKRLGNAVRRNRAKRLLREAFRSIHPWLSGGWEMAFFARSGIVGARQSDVSEAMVALLRRANLLQSRPPEIGSARGLNAAPVKDPE